MTDYTQTFSPKLGIRTKSPVPSSSIFEYSNNDVPETWTQELSWMKTITKDSILGRMRYAKIIISNTLNAKESIYTPMRRVRIREKTSNKIIFLGRVEFSNPKYDEQYGQILEITAIDYIRELFERKVNSDYSSSGIEVGASPPAAAWGAGHPTRADIINSLVYDYSYSGSITRNIEQSGSSNTITKNFTGYEKTIAKVIEELASEDFWTNETWGAAWRYNGVTWDNDTVEANSAGGVAFDFLGSSSHYFYLRQNNPFIGATFDLAAAGSYGAQTWQYWNGSTWANLTITKAYDFAADGTVKWNLETNWTAVAFSAIFPHAVAPPDAISGYWVRVSVASVTSTATVNQITCVRGVGYDYYVDDDQVFQYFRRGSKPSGGASANGLTIELRATETASKRAMLADYSFSDQPREIVTRVTCKGKASTGEDVPFTATDTALEAQYGIVKEKIDYVWGTDLSEADMLTYVTNRANALLLLQNSAISRAEVSITKYPYYGANRTAVRAGDVVRMVCSPKSIDADYLVLETEYQEPPGICHITAVGLLNGRSFSPLDMESILQGLASGGDAVFGSVRINDLRVTNAQIVELSVSKLIAGNLTVAATLATGGSIRTAASGTRIQITPSEIAGYNGSTVQFYLSAVDGTAYAGAGAIVLDANGLTVKGQYLKIKDSTNTYTGYLYQVSSTTILEGSEVGGLSLKTTALANAGIALVSGSSGLGWTPINLYSSSIDIHATQIKNLSDPTDAQDAATKSYADGLITLPFASQSVTSNTLDTVYQNTSGKTMLVVISVALQVQDLVGGVDGDSYVLARVDGSNPPTTQVAAVDNAVNSVADVGDYTIFASLVFIVPNGYYYKAVTGTTGDGVTPALSTWTEYT